MSRNNHPLAVGTSPQYGKHNMSHRHLTTLDVGRIQVMTLQECVTNDQISCNLKQVVTTAPNISPLQGKFIMHTAAFYVRNRVVMKDWNKYRTGMQNINIPHFDLDGLNAKINQRITSDPNLKSQAFNHLSAFGIDPLADYKTQDGNTIRSMRASLLPMRCYERLWWDWFRNSQVVPDTQEGAYLFSDNGNEDVSRYILPHFANWQKDLMSNYLRTPNGDSNVTSTSHSSSLDGRGVTVGHSLGGVSVPNINVSTPSNKFSGLDGNNFAPDYTQLGSGSSTDTTINSLRQALGLQAVIEKMNALGGRLKDRLKGMFGSSVSYEVLGMSELLGYNEYDVNFDTSASNNASASTTQEVNAFGTTNPQHGLLKGQLSGDSTMTENGLSGINYHCTEDGYFIILSWLTPDAMLSQGLDAHWFRGIDGISPSRYDFLTDEFVGKGFDPVQAYELVSFPKIPDANLGTYDPFKAIGFNAKYHNYSYHHDVVSGDFRRNETRKSMQNWLLERDVLKEQNVKNYDGDLNSDVTGTDIDNVVIFNNFQGLNGYTRSAYDANFMYRGSDVDHFVIQNKCELIMTRRLPSAPRVDLLTQSPVETGIGGTRL